MKNLQEIERTAEQTLNSLDKVQQIEANEYLYTKVLARINDNDKTVSVIYKRVMLRLAAILLLFIGINGASYYAVKHRDITVVTKKSSGADAFAEAYSLNNNLDSY